MWHSGLRHKLINYEISRHVFELIQRFLSNRELKVVLNAQSFTYIPTKAGVPQGFIDGPTLLLIFINDLHDDIICQFGIYADDTILYSCHNREADH